MTDETTGHEFDGIDKPTENWTRFPNCILDNLQDIEPAEFKVLALMIRKSLGWRDKANKRFAAKYVASKVGMAERTAWKALLGLQERGLIRCIGKEWHGLKLYEINWNKPKKIEKHSSAKNAEQNRTVKSAVLAQQKLPTVLETMNKETREVPVSATAYTLPRTFEQPKQSKPKPKAIADQECLHILNIMSEHDKRFARTQEIVRLIAKSIKENGFAPTEHAVRGRLLAKKGKELGWRWLFLGAHDFMDATAAYEKEMAAEADMQRRWNPEPTVITAEELASLEAQLAQI